MNEITRDPFYDFARQYDQDTEFHLVGEVEYHLLCDDKPYKGLISHREALISVFDWHVEKSVQDREDARKRRGDSFVEEYPPMSYDIDKAQPTLLTPQVFFYCPNIIKTDYYGNVFYDAEWTPNDDNFGTTVPYWYAVMEPVHGRRNKPEDFKKVNEALFPKGTDMLDIYEWSTDWSDLFDAGHEWYGSCCWSIYDKAMNRYVIMLVSATD